MKPAQIFRQYIWIIHALRTQGGMTFEELNQRWQDDKVADGNPLQRSSFDLRPTPDFLDQLLTHADGIEVLEPQDLRQKMRQMIENMLRRY